MMPAASIIAPTSLPSLLGALASLASIFVLVTLGFLVAGLLWERHDAEPQAASVPVDLPIRDAA